MGIGIEDVMVWGWIWSRNVSVHDGAYRDMQGMVLWAIPDFCMKSMAAIAVRYSRLETPIVIDSGKVGVLMDRRKTKNPYS